MSQSISYKLKEYQPWFQSLIMCLRNILQCAESFSKRLQLLGWLNTT